MACGAPCYHSKAGVENGQHFANGFTGELFAGDQYIFLYEFFASFFCGQVAINEFHAVGRSECPIKPGNELLNRWIALIQREGWIVAPEKDVERHDASDESAAGALRARHAAAKTGADSGN